MYHEKLVVAVKHNGRVLREAGDTVNLPFGSEYTLLIKNKNTVRALVQVEIDGVNATENVSLIVPANGTIELERFLKAENLQQGHRFKFIERTKAIEDGPRGVGAEDGLIRVQFEFERAPVRGNTWINDQWNRPSHGVLRSSAIGQFERSLSGHPFENAYGTLNAVNSVSQASFGVAATTDVQASAKSDVGITVPGSVSDQKFVTGSWFATDGVKHVLILKLLGQVGEVRVQEPVTVRTKQECPTCGTKNKHGAKFCQECGTGLTIV